LDIYGYEANSATQTATAINGIKLSVSLYASLPFLTAAALLFFYEINKNKELTIERELAERRQKAGVAQSA
jgi:GPH family glycoside/pentoside/hexuronide:cation symporter